MAMALPLKVPLLVRQRALAHGVAGQRWLDGLDEVVATLAERWALDLVEALSGGTASYVVAAIDRSGRSCVLKVGMPLNSDEANMFSRSVRSHQLADGRGCAKLLNHDSSVPAMLLERLGPNLHEMSMPVPDILETISVTLRNFWRPIPAEVGLPSGAEKALWLAQYISKMWTALDRPCPQAVIVRALRLCDERAAAFNPSRAVLVHGDAHGWNTLDAGSGSFKFIDPEGLRSEPEHDLSVAMREYNEPLLSGDTPRLVQQRAEFLATRCGADARAVWEWGFIERVSTGLAAIHNFGGDTGAAFLEVAARCL